MTLLLPTGELLTFGWGDTSPPGHVGLHTNVNRPWVRVNDGPWRPIEGRSMHRAIDYALAAETLDEFIEAAEVGEPRP